MFRYSQHIQLLLVLNYIVSLLEDSYRLLDGINPLTSLSSKPQLVWYRGMVVAMQPNTFLRYELNLTDETCFLGICTSDKYLFKYHSTEH